MVDGCNGEEGLVWQPFKLLCSYHQVIYQPSLANQLIKYFGEKGVSFLNNILERKMRKNILLTGKKIKNNFGKCMISQKVGCRDYHILAMQAFFSSLFFFSLLPSRHSLKEGLFTD